MTQPVSAPEIDRFYRAAVLGLGLLEARSGMARRFGPDADARWKAFRGGLQDWDRIELLVRDASVRNPAGFAPRVVFDLPALADDEPCGPDWPGPTPTEASTLLRSVASGPRELGPILEVVAAGWGLSFRPLSRDAGAGILASTKILLAGAGAVMSAAALFAGRPDLDLADQSVLVADDPGTRQLFGLALAYFSSSRPARIVRLATSPEDLRALGVSVVDRALVSDDVPPDTRAQMAALTRALGAKG